MKIELRRWTMSDSKELTALCNAVDRSFLSDRLPYPYTEEDAKAWLNMVAQNDSVTGIYRAIVMDGQPSSRWDRYLGMTAVMTQVPLCSRTANALTAVMLRPMSHSNLPQSTGLLRPVPSHSPQTSTARRASPSPMSH